MTRFWTTVGAVVVVSMAMLVFGMNKYARFDLRDASDGDLANRYRLVCGAYPDVQLDATRIPAELQSLIPIAARYGHGVRVILEDCAVKMDRASARNVANDISENRERIERWIATYPQDFPAKEVIAFRELLKLYALLRPATVEPNKAVS